MSNQMFVGLAERREGVTRPNLREQAQAFLKNPPRQRASQDSIRDYCHTGLSLIAQDLVDRFGIKDARSHQLNKTAPQEQEQFWNLLNNLKSERLGSYLIMNTAITPSGEPRFLSTSGSEIYTPRNGITKTLIEMQHDPNLSFPRAHNLIEQTAAAQLEIVPPIKRDHQMDLLAEYKQHPDKRTVIPGSRQAYTAAFNRLQDWGLFDGDMDLQRFVALLYSAQVHRDNAVQQISYAVKSSKVMYKENPGESSYTPGYPEAMIRTYLSPQLLGYLEFQVGRANELLETARQYGETIGLDNQQQEAIRDLAFLKRGTLPDGEYTQLAKPIVASVKAARRDHSKWDEVISDRGFLFTYFTGMFPDRRQTGGQTQPFTSIEELEAHIAEVGGKLPDGYRELLNNRAEQRRERAERDRLAELQREEEQEKQRPRQEFVQRVLFDRFIRDGRLTQALKGKLPAEQLATLEEAFNRYNPAMPIGRNLENPYQENVLPFPKINSVNGKITRTNVWYIYGIGFNEMGIMLIDIQAQPTEEISRRRGEHMDERLIPDKRQISLPQFFEMMLEQDPSMVTKETLLAAFAGREQDMEKFGVSESNLADSLYRAFYPYLLQKTQLFRRVIEQWRQESSSEQPPQE